MMSGPATVSVVEPILPAIERVKAMLFRPFNLTKWMTIGFCAWLAVLGEQGAGGNFNLPQDHHASLRHQFEQAKTFVLGNLHWIIPVVAALVVIGFVIGVAILWVNSRGKFMFLHCVALDVAEVQVPWSRFKVQGNSLFGFRFVLQMVALVFSLPLVVMGGVVVYRMLSAWRFTGTDLKDLILLVLGLLFLGCVFGVIHKFTTDFVVPIMFLRSGKCLAAWREFRTMLAANVGRFVLYLLFQIVLHLAISLSVLLLLVVTCCLCLVGCCLMVLPYISTVLFLPILVFHRSYSLYYLRQYGGNLDAFSMGIPPVAGAPAQPGTAGTVG